MFKIIKRYLFKVFEAGIKNNQNQPKKLMQNFWHRFQKLQFFFCMANSIGIWRQPPKVNSWFPRLCTTGLMVKAPGNCKQSGHNSVRWETQLSLELKKGSKLLTTLSVWLREIIGPIWPLYTLRLYNGERETCLERSLGQWKETGQVNKIHTEGVAVSGSLPAVLTMSCILCIPVIWHSGLFIYGRTGTPRLTSS